MINLDRWVGGLESGRGIAWFAWFSKLVFAMDCERKRPEVSFCQIFDYIGDRKRCLMEGEEVVKAGYIVACGIKEEGDSHVTVHALCIQTSGIRGQPHTVEACVKKGHFSVKCSCKAGLSGYCKHCIALLLHLHR